MKFLRSKGAKETVLIFTGQLLYALSLNLFLLQNGIAAGGFSGVATVLVYVFPISVGALVFYMNIPFFILALKMKGWKFTVKNFIASTLYSVLADSTTWLPTLTTNKMMAAICGGFIYGVGVALMVQADCAAGGTELVSRLLLTKMKGSSIGKIMMAVDGLVSVFAMVVFGNIEIGLYAILCLVVCSVTADKCLNGLDYASMCFIITKQPPEPMASVLMERLLRGATNIKATGMFNGANQNILIAVVKPKETYRLKELVAELDPEAFVVVAHANEVLGSGFKEIG